MKILIAIDEKKFVAEITDYIFKHQFPGSSEFEILNVIEPAMVGSYMSVLPPPLLDEISKEAWSSGERLVRQVALRLRDHFHSTNIKELVVSGFVASEIIQEAKNFQADLVILGSHGKRGFERFALGSVSSRVAAEAPCSVLIVQPKKAASKKSDNKSKLAASGFKRGK